MNYKKTVEDIIYLSTKTIVYDGKTYPPYTTMMKLQYQRYNFDKLKALFNEQGYEICDIKDAPATFPLLEGRKQASKDWFVYKKD